MKISKVLEMRAMDQSAIEEYGIREEILMENAGLAFYAVLSKKLDIKGRGFLIFCGIGNNGGDGLVIARKIHSNGGHVKIILLGDPEKFQGASKTNYEICKKISLDMRVINDNMDVISTLLSNCDVIIDAIFGTGLSRNVEGFHKQVILSINSSKKTVFSVDIPSGINGDNGLIMGVAIRANCTVAFGLPKVGNMLFPGAGLCGQLFVAHISFPPSLYEAESLKIETNPSFDLPPRKVNGHKGTFGQALFIAGAENYYGAPYFAALSFLKAGGGYSRLASPKSITPFIANKGSEIVFLPMNETSSGSISYSNKLRLLEISTKMQIVVIGPGLSLQNETQQLVRELVREIPVPLIIDGDGINAICDDLNCVLGRKAETILTPHPGEMSRIFKSSVSEIKSNRIEILQKTCSDLNAIILLKDAHTLIGYPDGKVYINLSGNSGMATAGSGDVLTGIIAAMYGLGLSISEAASKGVFIHGLSGDLAAGEIGEDGITAQDILEFVPKAVKLDRNGSEDLYRQRYDIPVIL
ncbi:MAG: NAD(P)H-hydrate dehydratase [Anaerolineaceae bacterium]|nr:NAD(P)H-hydrate dehydratase [Anaerolineaceae bacterium]